MNMSVINSCFSHYFFFFYCYVYHRHLHSFPTRRSSDLTVRRIGYCKLWKVLPGCSRDCAADAEPRSEEHTSELQSRGHLVCRLLLEKKKNDRERNHNENDIGYARSGSPQLEHAATSVEG